MKKEPSNYETDLKAEAKIKKENDLIVYIDCVVEKKNSQTVTNIGYDS